MSLLFGLSNLAQSSIGGRVIEGCKNACQYAVDKLQATFNSVASWLPLIVIATGILIYFAVTRRRREKSIAPIEPANFGIWKVPALVAFAVTLLRFALEKVAVSQSVAEAAGIGWLTVPFAMYFGLRAHRWRELFVNLALFVWSARLPVVILMVLASYLHWSTHYDISSLTHLDTQWGRLNYQPNSFRQHLHIIYLAQLVIMPFYSMATGMTAGAGIFLLKMLKGWYQARALKKVAFDRQ
jgi:hypothetical protein